MDSIALDQLTFNIKRLRKLYNWTQNDLAQNSGLTYHYIIKLEQGQIKNPGISALQKLCDTFKVTLDELLTI